MGCDIHAIIEVKNRGHPECGFSFAAKIELDRDYKMFSLMAGVRNYKELPQVSPLRGIPNDASCRTKEEYNLLGSDTHSSSFLYFYEYKNAVDFNSNYCTSYEACMRFMETYEQDNYETRIVFWFDN